MALTLGSASINASTAAETTSGMCATFYTQLKAALTPTEPTDLASKIVSREAIASLATAIATAMHTELTTNAQAKIATTDSGLQLDPASSDPTLAPATDKFVSIV